MYVCIFPFENAVLVEGNNIKVFAVVENVCQTITPIPPISERGVFEAAQVSGMNEGIYTIEYYQLGMGNDLPPLPVDYPTYYMGEIQFEVRRGTEPTSVNTASSFGLLLLTLCMLMAFNFQYKRSTF